MGSSRMHEENGDRPEDKAAEEKRRSGGWQPQMLLPQQFLGYGGEQ